MVSMRLPLALALLVVLLPAGSTAAARNTIIGMPSASASRRSLLDEAACVFNRDTPYLGSNLSFVVPMADALKCYSSILVNRSHASAQITGLKTFFNEYYAYTAIAKNPRAVPGASNVSFGLSVYSGKVDLMGGLDAIMKGWADGDVPLSEVLFPTTHLFNSLHDGHVSYDQGFSYGNVLLNHYLVLWDKANSTAVALKLKKIKERSTLLSGLVGPSCGFSCLLVNDSVLSQVDNIDGKNPLTWLTSVAADAVYNLPMKAVGNRVNYYLNRGTSSSARVSGLGLFSRLGAGDMAVQFKDGSNTTWAWHVRMPAYFPSNLTQISEIASIAGVPYDIQQSLEDILDDNTTKPVARRHMAAGAGPGVKLPRHWMDADALIYGYGAVIGTFGIKGDAGYSDYSAVFKLTSVSLSWDELLDAWIRFVNMTNQLPVPPTNLILDVSSNGGGDPSVSSLMAALLYPEILHPDNDYVFYTSDPRTVGPFADYLLSNGLFWKNINASHAIPPPADAAQARAAEIDAETLGELGALTVEWLTGVERYLNSSDALGPDGRLPDFLNSSLYGAVLDVLSTIQNSSSLDAETFSSLVSSLFDIAGLGQPFNATGRPSFFYTGNDTLPLYDADTLERFTINEQNVTITAKYFDVTKRDYVEYLDQVKAYFQAQGQELPVHPFKSVLAVTDGFCGSSCDLLVRASWTYSRVNASAMPFKSVTFGGTGHEKDITATVFPGGNVESNRYYAQQTTGQSTAWFYYGTLHILSRWLGDTQLLATLEGARALIPGIPEALAYMPRFAFTNSYLPALNSGEVPNEYLLLPPDHYIRQWYYLGWDAQYSSADQMALYDVVVKRF